MFRCCMLLLLSVAAGLSAERTVLAQFRYPRVYGATGQPYGPTQAHYQYQRQYGRPWHGYGGLTASSSYFSGVNVVGGGLNYYHGPVGGYGGPIAPYAITPFGTYYPPYGNAGYFGGYSGPAGFADFGPNYSYIPMSPLVIQAHPQFIGQNPFDNAVLQDALRENDERWGPQIVVEPQKKAIPKIEVESNPAAKLKSMRTQAQGDEWFRQQKYLQAYDRYRAAITEASDRAEPHFRLALTYAALGRFELASDSFQRGVAADPDYAPTSLSLDDIFGLDNSLAKSGVASRIVEWVRADIRDSERLFLLGMWLFLDGQPQKASVLFETALRLSGRGDHLVAMLEHSGNTVALAPAQPAAQVLEFPQPAAPQAPGEQLPLPAGKPSTEQPSLPPLPMP